MSSGGIHFPIEDEKPATPAARIKSDSAGWETRGGVQAGRRAGPRRHGGSRREGRAQPRPRRQGRQHRATIAAERQQNDRREDPGTPPAPASRWAKAEARIMPTCSKCRSAARRARNRLAAASELEPEPQEEGAERSGRERQAAREDARASFHTVAQKHARDEQSRSRAPSPWSQNGSREGEGREGTGFRRVLFCLAERRRRRQTVSKKRERSLRVPARVGERERWQARPSRTWSRPSRPGPATSGEAGRGRSDTAASPPRHRRRDRLANASGRPPARSRRPRREPEADHRERHREQGPPQEGHVDSPRRGEPGRLDSPEEDVVERGRPRGHERSRQVRKREANHRAKRPLTTATPGRNRPGREREGGRRESGELPEQLSEQRQTEPATVHRTRRTEGSCPPPPSDRPRPPRTRQRGGRSRATR